MSGMDPFDEFEFKPLTDGLGFHKKAVSLKEGLKTSGVVEEEMQNIPRAMPKDMMDETPLAPLKKHTFEDVLQALEKSPLKRSDLQFTEPLPRAPEKLEAMDIDRPRPVTPLPQAPPVQSPFPQAEVFRTRAKEVAGPAAGTRRGAADSPQRKLEPAAVSITSALLDGIIVMALSLLFLIALLMVTKVDMNVVLNNLDKDKMTQVSLAMLFVAVMQMYAIVARSFFGRTLGEWTFDLQIGKDDEQTSETYPLRIAWRSLINTITGLILLPVVSLLWGKDIAGKLSGVQLYRHRA